MNDGVDETGQQINQNSDPAGVSVERQPAQARFDGTLDLPGRRGRAHLQAVPCSDDVRQGARERLAAGLRAAHRALYRAAYRPDSSARKSEHQREMSYSKSRFIIGVKRSRLASRGIDMPCAIALPTASIS